MERKIEFRGKRVDNGEWLNGSLHYHDEVKLCIASKEQAEANQKAYIIFDGMADWNLSVPMHCLEVVKSTTGQFIGLKDRNGKKIFEGDIIKTETEKAMVVSWNNHFASFCLDRSGWMFTHYFGEVVDPEQIEIIGNIHDNAELLK